jgi:Ca2+-binding EF-hand superfamily protein
MASQHQLNKWPAMFNALDANKDGRLEAGDLAMLASKINESGASSEALEPLMMKFWTAVLQAADTDGQDGVVVDEWLTFWRGVVNTENRYEELVRPINELIYVLLDQNKDGSVSIDELQGFYGMLGIASSHAAALFARAGLSSTDTISRTHLNQLTDEYMVGDDPEAAGNIFFG